MAELSNRQFGGIDLVRRFKRGWDSREDRQRDRGHTHRQRMSRDTRFGIVGRRWICSLRLHLTSRKSLGVSHSCLSGRGGGGSGESSESPSFASFVLQPIIFQRPCLSYV